MGFFFFFLWLKLRPITKMLWKSSKDYIICLYGWYINKAIFLHTSFEEWPRTLLSQPAATGVSNGSMVQIHPPSTIELSKKSFDEWLLCQDLPHHFLGMGGGRGRWSELTCTVVGDEKKSWMLIGTTLTLVNGAVLFVSLSIGLGFMIER